MQPTYFDIRDNGIMLLNIPDFSTFNSQDEYNKIKYRTIEINKSFYLSQDRKNKFYFIHYIVEQKEDYSEERTNFEIFLQLTNYINKVHEYGGNVNKEWNYTYFYTREKAIHFINNYLEPMVIMAKLTGIIN